MKLSSGCRCWGKWDEGQQGAEKEDEVPAAAADRTNSRALSVRASDFALHGSTISKVRVSGGTEAILIQGPRPLPQPPHASGRNISCNYPHSSVMVL